MDNLSNNSLTRLYKELKGRAEVRTLIPMGYVPGMPIITIKNEQLVAIVPFLRYKATGEVDRTLVFPIRYTLEYLLPECQLVGFKDLSLDAEYCDFDFEKVIGFFRHDAVKHMDKGAFLKFKQETIAEFDKLVNYLIGENDDYSSTDENSLTENLQTIVEPFLTKQYALLDSDFYNKYLNR